MRLDKSRILPAAALLLAALSIGQMKLLRSGADSGEPPAEAVKAGIHLAQGQRISYPYNLSDGAGYNWDLQPHGGVNQGTPYAYGGGLYCQANGNSFRANVAWANAAGDEAEFGPHNQGSMRVYRRVKVYKDAGLARWLDIYENPSTTDVTLQITVQTNSNWNIAKSTGSSGENGFGAKDFAFITEQQETGNNTPVLLHIVCDRKSKVRPTVDVQSNQFTVRYNITVKAGQTAILCYFESQGPSAEAHTKFLKGFQPHKYLRDVSPAARRLIVNFAPSGAANLELERSDRADTVVQTGGQPVFGTVANESFTVQTDLLGTTKIAAPDLVGMIASKYEGGAFHLLLKDGQVLYGQVQDKTLQLRRDSGNLEIPFEKIGQWSFQISDKRPYDIPVPLPSVSLRTGERLKFDPAGVKLHMRSLQGSLEFKAADLVSVRMDNVGSLHRATFLNGSTISGMIEDGKLTADFALGGKGLAVDRNLIRTIDFVTQEQVNPMLTRATLANQDEIMGELADEKLSFLTEFGPVDIKPDSIRQIVALPGKGSRFAALTWDGTTIRGSFAQETIGFEIMPGPVIKLSPAQFATILRMQPLPPGETRKKVESLIGLLAAESGKDRQTGSDELVKLGPTILPLLQKYLSSPDSEVRQRVLDIIDRLSGGKVTTPAVVPVLME
jgi:hypothetical protein